MTNRIRVIAVAFCVVVLTGHIVAEPIDPKDWAMYCWKSGWKRFPLDKATVKAGPMQLEIKNTTGIHRHAYLVFTGGTLTGDFQMTIELNGGKYFGITDASGRDASITVPSASKWRTITMTRRGKVVTCLVDGKETGPKLNHATATMVGMPFIFLNSNATVMVRRFEIVNGDYFAGWPTRVIAGATLRYRPKHKTSGMTCTLVSGPVGMKMNKTGELTWTPSSAVSGVQQVKIRLTVGKLSVDQSAGVEVVTREQLAAAKVGTDPKNWAMYCLQRSKWKRFPLDKATVRTGLALLEVKNTTGIHTHVQMAFPGQRLAGDFTMTIELSGGLAFGMMDASGGDAYIAAPPGKGSWQIVTMTRRGKNVTCSVDGKAATLKIRRAAPTMVGIPCIFIGSNATASVRRFEIVNGNYFAGWPTRVAAGTVLRHRPKLKADKMAFELVSGPAGMTMDKTGELTWALSPVVSGSKEVKVRLTVGGFSFDQSTGIRVLTREQLAASKEGIDPKNWAMYCYQDRKWNRFPLGKATVKAAPALLEVKNTTGIHSYAKMVFPGQRLAGDFLMTIELNGRGAFGITDACGRDPSVTAPAAPGWRKITMIRCGKNITCSVDGKPARVRIERGPPRAKTDLGPTRMLAMPFVAIWSGHTASVRRFQVINGSYFAGWPDWLVEGTTLRHRPTFDPARVTCKLVSGPAGMTMDKAGQLTWAPPAAVGGVQQVKVRLSIGELSFDRSAEIQAVTRAQLAAFKLGLDPKDWQMLCKERNKWRLHPLDKATVKAGSAQLEVKNTTGIHSSACLVFTRQPKGIEGDFQMVVQLKGGRQFGLKRRPSEYDGSLSIPIVADKWQTITMTRRGREIECTVDGKNTAYKKRAMHEYMGGLPFVLLNTDEVVAIRRFHVINRLIDENYFHKCPGWVAEGKMLKYQPGFDKPPAVCELVSGPKGMTVSKDGQLTWTPTAKDLGWHTVKVRLEVEGFPLAQSTSVKVVSKAFLAKVGGDAGKIADLFRRKIAKDHYITPGMGRTLLLVEGMSLTTLGADGLTVVKTLKLPKAYTRIAERKGHYVALANKPQISIDVVDKKIMKVSRSRPVPGLPLRELVLHPSLPISYVSLGQSLRSSQRRFVMFYEETAQAREPKDATGEWLAIDPKGKFLITGYCRMHKSGSRLVNNTRSLRGYGDNLMRFTLAADGRPTLAETKSKPGTNGRGIRLSPDGARVAYLSYTGYPERTGNLAGWTPTDLEIMPTAYVTSGKGSTSDLAYHPYLKLAASRTKTGAMFFDSHTGKIQTDRLRMPGGGLRNATIHRVYFSPDGLSVIFHIVRKDVHYLRKVELNLTAKERAGAKPTPVP